MVDGFVYRTTQRDAICRGCDKTIKKNTETVFYTYSQRNKGQHIFICGDCHSSMNVLIMEGMEDREDEE